MAGNPSGSLWIPDRRDPLFQPAAWRRDQDPGEHTFLYTDDLTQRTELQEFFPIPFPDGVTLEFVPDGSSNPPRATFAPNGSGVGVICFKIVGAFPNSTAFQGHFFTDQPAIPDPNQGILIQDFGTGILVVPSSNSASLNLDGIRFDGCQTGLKVDESTGGGSVVGTLQRSRVLGSSGTLSPTSPLVDLQVMQGSHLALTLQEDVVLPQQIDLMSNGVNLEVQDTGSTADLTLQNVTIQGRPDLSPPPPPPFPRIGEAGLKFVYGTGTSGSVTINDTTIQNANGAGIFGLADGGQIALNGSGNRVLNNGKQAPSGQPGFGITFSRSGMMLVLNETGGWNPVNFQDSWFNGNKVHGAHLLGKSDDTQIDQFANVEFIMCQFKDNGKNAPTGPFPFNGQGHGFFSDQKDVELHALFRRSRFTGNGTCGLRLDFGDSLAERNHTLGISNSVFAGNQGKNSQDLINQSDINPLTVISESIQDKIEIQLAQLTISDNPTPYSVSIVDKANNMPDRLWRLASQARNCIFDGNGRDLGLGKVDAAFFPLPSATCPSSTDLWCLFSASTMRCVLGDQGLSAGQMAFYDALVSNPNNDVIDNAELLDLQLWQDLGLVFPAQNQILDKGVDMTNPSDSLDFRGAPRLFDDPNISNASMQSGKDIGAFEKQANE